jgi:hypothetical protein
MGIQKMRFLEGPGNKKRSVMEWVTGREEENE